MEMMTRLKYAVGVVHGLQGTKAKAGADEGRVVIHHGSSTGVRSHIIHHQVRGEKTNKMQMYISGTSSLSDGVHDRV